MPIDNFPSCLAVTLAPENEGGFSNDPQDPGGVTNHGVTARNWAAWMGHAVTVADMRTLTIAQVTPFYRAQFWQAMACAKMPAGVDLCLFDAGVNISPGRAVMLLQKVVGVAADGHAGGQTALAVQGYASNHGRAALVNAYQDARATFYRSRAGFGHDGNGWLARTARIRVKALEMGA